MNQRKQTLIAIANLNQTLQIQQRKLNQHKSYFWALFQKNKRIVGAKLLIITFLAGWFVAKVSRTKLILNQLVRIGMLTVFSFVKTRFLSLH